MYSPRFTVTSTTMVATYHTLSSPLPGLDQYFGLVNSMCDIYSTSQPPEKEKIHSLPLVYFVLIRLLGKKALLYPRVLIYMQGKKFKDKGHGQEESSSTAASDSDLNLTDCDRSSADKSGQYQMSWARHSNDGAGDGFVTSVKGLFNSQRRKAKALVLRTMRSQTENKLKGECSENDAEFSPFARQLTITNATKLIRRHTKKFHSIGQKGLLHSFLF